MICFAGIQPGVEMAISVADGYLQDTCVDMRHQRQKADTDNHADQKPGYSYGLYALCHGPSY